MLTSKSGHASLPLARVEKDFPGLNPRLHRQRARPLASSQKIIDKELKGSEGISSALQVLQEASAHKSVDPEKVEEAMAHIEKHQRQHGQTKQAASSVDGKWRLVFSTSTKLRMFQYIPVTEDLRIDVGAKKISLESVLGPFNFLINGEVSSFDEATGALEFQFQEVQVFLSGNKVWAKERPATPAKTYTFFYVDTEEGNNTSISVARSSAGGMSLLLRNPE